jgi:predicted CxxxxCH...CXXCH cytochrome family protein
MSSTVSWTKIFCMLVACCALLGCSAANDQAPALGSDSKHPDGWRTAHRRAYQQNRDQCFECHGTDLKGGITKVDCFNQAALGQCHANGHGPRNVPHELPFTAGSLHGPAAKNDLVYCQSCHGTSGGPGGNPRFNVPLGALLNGCEDCHKPFTAHPPLSGSTSGWSGHSSAGSMGSNCTLCHGVDLSGSGGVGPGCNSCHTGLNTGAIPTVGACTSCHAKPPVTGNHTKHNALVGVADVCGTCHDGVGNNTAKHNNGIKEVAFAAAYNAKSGTATRNVDGSCSNVSCHGGITTPAWGAALTAGCLSCHTKGTALNTPQFNSYYSGRHTEHLVDFGLQCADCHDMTMAAGGAKHFSGLGTSGFELPPSTTIRVPGYTAATPSCTPGKSPPSGTYSVGVCHSSKDW